ncbi:hypothetical protein MFLAVUS_002348 [Mucor flavus]|uniref:Uncharacterized protein n=1 Tax=Mucor flavus TaxID=439312 RepID=A0ABP9YQ02_9FUNG
MAITPSKNTLMKENIVKSYLETTSKATFNQFVVKKEKDIGEIEVGATSALQLMNHWISLYNEQASTRRATAKVMKFPTRPSVKFGMMYKKLKALRAAKDEYELEAIITLGRYAGFASASLERYRENCSKIEEDSGRLKNEEDEQ